MNIFVYAIPMQKKLFKNLKFVSYLKVGGKLFTLYVLFILSSLFLSVSSLAEAAPTITQTPEQARKFISAPRPVSVKPSSPVKIGMVSETTVKDTVDRRIKNKQAVKGEMSVRTTADAKDNVSSVARTKQQKVTNGKNKLNCKKDKAGQNLKCSFSDKETVVPQDPANPPVGIPPSMPLNIDGRNKPPPPSPYK